MFKNQNVFFAAFVCITSRLVTTVATFTFRVVINVE